ncbi:MAG TPA: serine/threonine protein phosphatase, partial [Candidatus Dormibacteraeota bacterium]|nr:serine/threonine protein phosphatase [Candidatus Dormibacteraeota bacterium]
FSGHVALNGKYSRASHPNVNDRLLEAVRPGFDRVACWMWGHEHSLAVFEDGLLGVNKPRLVGCSAFEMDDDEDPYSIKFDNVRHRQPEVKLGISNGWYDHAFTILDIERGEVAASYYSFPSWSEDAPDNPCATPLYKEEIPRVVRR